MMSEYFNRLLAERRQREASLGYYLQRFVTETDKREEFLAWLAKDMGLDKPLPLPSSDAAIEIYNRRTGN
jgi:hypothetical protein